ncbi:MAG TPA: formate dehydrogenase accessory protein FdhE [Methylomirabilota bacterium]|jgi:FdhE protein
MVSVRGPALREQWRDLLARRPSFRSSLGFYDALIDVWAAASPSIAPLRWKGAECAEHWERGIPLLATAPPALTARAMEDVLGAVVDLVSPVVHDAGPALERLGEAWDRGAVTPADFFPAKGQVGSAALVESVGLGRELAAFLAAASLPPFLETYFAEVQPRLEEGTWQLGVCPFCGGPPAFGDIVENGQRRLACHLCGGAWPFPRLQCPLCGTHDSRDAVRLDPGPGEEGYAIVACKACGGYVKELDRRLRWNGGGSLVEDWGSPHFDVAARGAGYWRPVPSLVDVAHGGGAVHR